MKTPRTCKRGYKLTPENIYHFFETCELALATYLMTKEYKLLEVEVVSRRVTFRFEPTAKHGALAFVQGDTVPAKRFVQNHHELRNRIAIALSEESSR